MEGARAARLPIAPCAGPGEPRPSRDIAEHVRIGWRASRLASERIAEAFGPVIAQAPGSIELRGDGSYKFNGQPGGRYRRSADQIVFDGALSSWNKGRAQLKDDVLAFKWKNAEGFNNWFVFQKG